MVVIFEKPCFTFGPQSPLSVFFCEWSGDGDCLAPYPLLPCHETGEDLDVNRVEDYYSFSVDGASPLLRAIMSGYLECRIEKAFEAKRWGWISDVCSGQVLGFWPVTGYASISRERYTWSKRLPDAAME